MIAALVRRLPRPLRVPISAAGVHTGKHRGPRFPGQLVDTEFRYCPRCDVDTAAIVHGDGSHTCTENHQTVPGDPT